MKALFLTVVEVSISNSLVIVFLLIFSSCLGRRYAAKWKYLMWIAIAVRLIIPLHFDLPIQKIVVDVPAQITTPIGGNAGAEAPILLPIDPVKAKITLLDMTAWLWLIGCLVLLAVHIFSYLHWKRRILRDGEVLEDERISRCMCSLAEELRIRPNIRVFRYPGAGSPMMIGFFRPVLVLPDDEYREEELFFILKHELIHLKRHDIYFKLLFVAAKALHWFNPLLYVMQKEAVIELELSCDEEVIRQMPYDARKVYTETLFSILDRQYKKAATLTTQFYGEKKVMEKRFRNILMKSQKRNGVLICICVICCTLVSGMLVGCSAANENSVKLFISTPEQAYVTFYSGQDEFTWELSQEEIDQWVDWMNNLSVVPIDLEESKIFIDHVYGHGSPSRYSFGVGENYSERFEYIDCGPEHAYLRMNNDWYRIENPTEPFNRY